jgi:hypothetical protein
MRSQTQTKLVIQNKEYDQTCTRKLPSQKCRGPKLPESTYHVMHPPQQSQMFDSRPDLRCWLEPEKAERIVYQNFNLSTMNIISYLTIEGLGPQEHG